MEVDTGPCPNLQERTRRNPVSTSILYHGWGLEDYRYLTTKYIGGALWFHVEKQLGRRRCSSCGSADVVHAGQRERTWKTVPIGRRPVYIVAHLHRLSCATCGRVLLEPLLIAEPKKTFTRLLARYALDLCRKATISDVAELTGLPWDAIAAILRDDLEARKKRIDWRHLRHLAIDEVSVGKGQKNYLTVVLDLDSGRVVFVTPGRSKAGLAPFFKQLRRSRTKLEAVAMDMHEPFKLAVEEYYRRPVAIVYDHFHVMKLLNEQLDDIRRDEARRVEDVLGKRLIKGSRYLLLRAQENLKPDAQVRLNELLAVNSNLSKAYILKEALRDVFRSATYQDCEKKLKDWLAQALGSGVSGLLKFAKTVMTHWDGILAFFHHRISTGPLEAINNKIGLLKRKAFGYRNRAFFALRILFIHECKSNLSGC